MLRFLEVFTAKFGYLPINQPWRLLLPTIIWQAAPEAKVILHDITTDKAYHHQ